jgi:hypothetical protein
MSRMPEDTPHRHTNRSKQMDKATYREIFATLNAEREAADRALAAVRRLKAQIQAEEEEAIRRANASERAVRSFESKYDI